MGRFADLKSIYGLILALVLVAVGLAFAIMAMAREDVSVRTTETAAASAPHDVPIHRSAPSRPHRYGDGSIDRGRGVSGRERKLYGPERSTRRPPHTDYGHLSD